jgi:hypothetical protein
MMVLRPKLRLVGLNEDVELHWRRAGDFLDEVIGSGKDAIVVVHSDLYQVLPERHPQGYGDAR